MSSLLIISKVENLQGQINKSVKSFGNVPGIYISLNKTQKGIEEIFVKNKIKTDKMFFIDCVTSEKVKEDTLYISPNNLDNLNYAIANFIKDIKGGKFLIIDALSTLLIYNPENKVAAFVKDIVELSSKNNVNVVALSPSTKGEDLLNKIFNFFDKVKKDEEGEERVKDEWEEELIY